jgi:predicted MFS family arabinose efflux permease
MNAVGTAAGGWALDSSQVGLSDMLWAMAALTLVPGALWTLWITIGKRHNLPAPEI